MLTQSAIISAELKQDIDALYTRYAEILDDDELEQWPTLFTEFCRYVIQPRENHVAGLEGYWLYFDSNAMLRDRILSLRKANLYNIHQDRHLISGVRIVDEQDGVYTCRASYTVIQSNVEGRAAIFSVGEYRDKIVLTDDGPRFQERWVIVDNFNMEGLLAIPL